MLVLSPVVTATLLSTIYGQIYDAHSTFVGDCGSCSGVNCFRPIYYVTSALLSLGLVISYTLTRHVNP
jgi:hypothetical protein